MSKKKECKKSREVGGGRVVQCAGVKQIKLSLNPQMIGSKDKKFELYLFS